MDRSESASPTFFEKLDEGPTTPVLRIKIPTTLDESCMNCDTPEECSCYNVVMARIINDANRKIRLYKLKLQKPNISFVEKTYYNFHIAKEEKRVSCYTGIL